MSGPARKLPAPPRDRVRPFDIEGPGLRGRLVRLDRALAEILAPHDYPGMVAAVLSEAVALAVVLASGLKYDGVFTLQTQGDGPVNLIAADVSSGGTPRSHALRAYARFDAEAIATLEKPSLPRLLGAGHLAFTVDQGPDTERYQGITDLAGATLSECAHHYFRQSEQVETAIVLAARGGRAAALMVQRLPAGDAAGDDDDAWRRAVVLMGSATAGELLDPGLSDEALLYRLYHEDGVRLHAPRALRHQCRCSGERVARTLAAFPETEVLEMMEEGRIKVTCEFCKQGYAFDQAALAALR